MARLNKRLNHMRWLRRKRPLKRGEGKQATYS
jgi:hypothetical protein